MNKFFTKIIGASLAIAMMIGVGAGINFVKEAEPVNADPSTTTYVFSSKAWAASPANWTSGKDGNQMQSGRGVQVTTGSTGANATSPVSYTDVSQIVVTYSTNASNGAGAIIMKVGNNADQSKNVTKTGGTTDRTLTWDYSTRQSGSVKMTVNCTTNSIYVKSVAITTNSTAEQVTVTGITKKTAPTKTAYYPGENFEADGLVITVSYSNDTSVDVTYDEHPSDFSWSPTTITEAGDVEIQYNDYSTMKVTQAVTLVTPLTVAQAKNAIDSAQNHIVQKAYVEGKISQIDSFSDKYNSITYWISDDGTTSNQFQVYSGKGLNGADFGSKEDIGLGSTVVVYGTIKLYNEIYEFDKNSQLKSYVEEVKTLVSISLSGDFQTSFFVNEAFNHTGMIVKANYDNGSAKDVTEQATFSSPAMAHAKRQIVTVSYTEGGVTKTATYRIIVRTRISTVFSHYTDFSEENGIADGDYIIYYGDKAIKNTIAGNRAEYATVSLNGSDYTSTQASDTDMIWHIAKDGNYYSIYNAKVGKYLAATGSNNQAALVTDKTDDKAKWIISSPTAGTYEFENYGRRNVDNRYLRNNSTYGFACYASGTGGALSLYKSSARIEFYNSITKTSLSYQYTLDDGVYTYSHAAIRFTGSVSINAWDEINSAYTIKAYGIMMAQTSIITTYGQDKTIKELYQGILNMYSVDESFSTVNGQKYIRGYENKIKCFMTEVPDSETHPYKLGNEYGWNLYKNIDDSLDGASQTALTTSYTGVAFIKTQTGGVFFMNEENITAGELAFKLANNGTTFANKEIEGSMKQMANLNVAA